MLTLLAGWLLACAIIVALAVVAPRVAKILVLVPFLLIVLVVGILVLPVAYAEREMRRA